MNNNFFSLVRYLRDRAVDADLILLHGEAAHFHPANDTFALDYQVYTHRVSWGGSFAYSSVSASDVRRDLAEYDVLIACGSAPAYIHKAGRSVDLFIPYGGDILYEPFLRLVHPRYQWSYGVYSMAQKQAIRKARAVSVDVTNDIVEEALAKLDIRDRRISFGIPMVYTGIYSPVAIESYYDRSHWYHEFKAIRERHDIVVFHHARHVWKTRDCLYSVKRNDKLVRGFAKFLRESFSDACLILLEYGPDVNATQSLVEDLSIRDKVYWFPQMARKDLMVGLSLADIGTGEFNMSWLSCGTVYEVLAMGKPLLHFRNDELYKGLYPELYPLMNASTEMEIAELLERYSVDRAPYVAMGAAGREWLQKWAVDAPVDAFMQLIERKVGESSRARHDGYA